MLRKLLNQDVIGAVSKQNPNQTVVKRTKIRELVRTAEEDCVELVERHFGEKTGQAACGVVLCNRALEVWKEEGGRRAVALSEELPEDEARWVKEQLLRIKSFANFAILVIYLLYVREVLESVRAGARNRG